MKSIVGRKQAATGLLIIAAVGAFGAFLSTLPTVLQADAATRMVETWRLGGFIVFAGLFSLLAWRPQHYPGVWELVICHKGVLALIGIMLVHTATVDALNVAISDGILALLLISAYILARGYKSWSHI